MYTSYHKPIRAFTLVELLVSMTIISLLLVLLAAITDATHKSWRVTAAKAQQFGAARDAFEVITRRLSQATLNTYWDYSYPNNDQTKPPTGYIRQSELRFISNTASGLGLGVNRYTHGIFFQAPLGYVSSSNYTRFRNLLNTWGYFIEYGTDKGTRPAFTETLLPYRNRFRLMELMEPSDAMTLYQAEVQNGGAAAYTGKEWYLTPLASSANLEVVSDNIIALVILPKLSPGDQAAGNYDDCSLVAPAYLYDSTGQSMSTCADPNLNPKNQLPPVVQVAMVAIDEVSASRMGDAGAASLQGKLNALFSDPTKLQADLQILEKYLINSRINYRIFTTNVSIRSAKWSHNQTN